MSTTPRVLIVGAGAIGALVGSALSKAGARVAVTCRSDFDAVQRAGFQIDVPSGSQRFIPERVIHDVSEYAEIADYVIVCVKVIAQVDRAALIRAAVSPQTCIVLIENGVEIEEEIARAYPHNEIISGLAYVGVARTAPGHVVATIVNSLVFGTYAAALSERTRQLAALCAAGGLPARVTENVRTDRWQKAVWNASFNPVSVLGGVIDTHVILATPERVTLIRRAMHEVCAVAAAVGASLPADIVEQTIARTGKAPAYKSSMALDYEHGRTMEVEAILGNIVRAAARHNVATPVLDSLYALMQMIESRVQSQ